MSSQDIKVGDKVIFKRYSRNHVKGDLTFNKIYTVITIFHDELGVLDDVGDRRRLEDSFEKVEEPIFHEISDRIQKLIDESQEAINASQATINKLNECRNLLTS